MTRYLVNVTRVSYEVTTIEVESDSPKNAQDKAKGIIRNRGAQNFQWVCNEVSYHADSDVEEIDNEDQE